jgi:hypothetical protein
VYLGKPGQEILMDAKTQSAARRGSTTTHRAPHDGHRPYHEDEHTDRGIDLPVVGHIPYESVGFLVGLGVAGAVGILEWPVVAAVGVGYALARRKD